MKKLLTLLFLTLILAACSVGIEAQTPEPTATRPPTVTPLPVYQPATSTPTVLKRMTLDVGDTFTLKTAGDGIVVIEVKGLWDGFSNTTKVRPIPEDRLKFLYWQVSVSTNIGLQPDPNFPSDRRSLNCTFEDHPNFMNSDCLGRLDVDGEVWPNPAQPTGIEDMGLTIEGRRHGVMVTYDSRWEIVK